MTQENPGERPEDTQKAAEDLINSIFKNLYPALRLENLKFTLGNFTVDIKPTPPPP
jgi:hypothetical protein